MYSFVLSNVLHVSKKSSEILQIYKISIYINNIDTHESKERVIKMKKETTKKQRRTFSSIGIYAKSF